MKRLTLPNILCFSGLDPTGGAGIQADIEAISAMGAHACPIITANTVQDTHSVYEFTPIAPEFIHQQATRLLDDMAIQAIKIGMLGSITTAQAVLDIIQLQPQIPVIFDPVLASGHGAHLAEHSLTDFIRQQLLPLTTILTPNTLEAVRLSGSEENAISAAQHISQLGVEYVLLTGTHASTTEIEHQLIHQGDLARSFTNSRLPGEYHGSGCTLAASLAALIAKKLETVEACQQALDYTFNSLRQATSQGQGQMIPRRIS